MRCSRAAISIVFLFLYALLGLAHTWVPHCHVQTLGDTPNVHHHHQHEVHQPNNEKNPDHQHILHGNHFDTGLYDLVVCFLSELEHPATNCHNANHVAEINDVQVFPSINLFAVLISLYHFTPSQQPNLRWEDNNRVKVHSPTLNTSPHRGPPIVSC